MTKAPDDSSYVRSESIGLSDLAPSQMAHLFQEVKESELTDPYESHDMHSQHEI